MSGGVQPGSYSMTGGTFAEGFRALLSARAGRTGLTILIIAVIAGSAAVVQLVRDRVEQRFLAASSGLVRMIESELAAAELLGVDLAYQPLLNDPVPEQWGRVVAKALERHGVGGFRSAWYVEAIAATRLDERTRDIRSDAVRYPSSYRTFSPRVSGTAEQSAIVTVVEPFEPESGWVGADLADDESLGGSIEKARDSGEAIEVVRQDPSDGERLVSVIYPIYERGTIDSISDRRSRLKGYVITSFSPRTMVSKALASAGQDGILAVTMFGDRSDRPLVVNGNGDGDVPTRWELSLTGTASFNRTTWGMLVEVSGFRLVERPERMFVIVSCSTLVLLVLVVTMALAHAAGRLQRTERETKLALEALSRREEQVRLLSEGALIPLCIITRELSCVYFNSAYQELTGLPFSRISGDGWHSVFKPDDLERLAAKLAAAGDFGAAFEEQLTIETSSGANAAKVRVTLVRSGGTVTSALLAFSDGKEFKLLREQLAAEIERRAELEHRLAAVRPEPSGGSVLSEREEMPGLYYESITVLRHQLGVRERELERVKADAESRARDYDVLAGEHQRLRTEHRELEARYAALDAQVEQVAQSGRDALLGVVRSRAPSSESEPSRRSGRRHDDRDADDILAIRKDLASLQSEMLRVLGMAQVASTGGAHRVPVEGPSHGPDPALVETLRELRRDVRAAMRHAPARRTHRPARLRPSRFLSRYRELKAELDHLSMSTEEELERAAQLVDDTARELSAVMKRSTRGSSSDRSETAVVTVSNLKSLLVLLVERQAEMLSLGAAPAATCREIERVIDELTRSPDHDPTLVESLERLKDQASELGVRILGGLERVMRAHRDGESVARRAESAS